MEVVQNKRKAFSHFFFVFHYKNCFLGTSRVKNNNSLMLLYNVHRTLYSDYIQESKYILFVDGFEGGVRFHRLIV